MWVRLWAIPWVEEPLACYLSPDIVSSLKSLVLPTKPCHNISLLVGRAHRGGAIVVISTSETDVRILPSSILRANLVQFRFNLLTVSSIVSQSRSKDWCVTIGLKDTYFSVFIIPSHGKFLRFAIQGCGAFQYWVLPFGPTLSPLTFTKCMDEL